MLLPTTELLHRGAAAAVVIGWILFGAIFVLRKAPPRERETRRAPASRAGIASQCAAFLVVGLARRASLLLIPAMPPLIDGALSVAVIGLTGLSVWTVKRAVDTLGKQWSLTARLVEGHRLITEGPYRLVRHPIYSGMLGMLIATACVASRWEAIPVGLTLFAIGTAIRIRSEERLLRESFPQPYADYAARVRAVIPWIL